MQRKAHDQGHPRYHQASAHPTAKNEFSISDSLYKPRGRYLKDIHQGSQSRNHTQNGCRRPHFFKVEHHGQPHDQVKGAGVENLK
jgi:hypothetical protein